MEILACPKCQGNSIVKSGVIKDRQRYLCKKCNYYFTVNKIGKKIDESKIEYSGAMNKLVEGKGNLIISVEKLKKMGAKAKKSLPESILNRAEKDENQLLN